MSNGKHSAGSRRGKTAIIVTIILAALIAAGVMVFVFMRNSDKSDPIEDYFSKYSDTFEAEVLNSEPLLISMLSGVEPSSIRINSYSHDTLESDIGTIRSYRIESSRGSARTWVFEDGSVFWCEQSRVAFELTLECGSGSARRLLESDARSPLLLPSTNSDDCGMLIQPPLASKTIYFEELRYEQYVAVDEQNGSAEQSDRRVKISFDPVRPEDYIYGDWWVYLSPDGLRDNDETLAWLYDCTVEKFGADNRMTLYGYYYISPSDYEPSGDGYYYLNPAAYIPNKLARRSGNIDARQIAVAMLDIQRDSYRSQFVSQGQTMSLEERQALYAFSPELSFIPTVPLCKNLNEKYGLPAGFHDTRFNTELALALITLGNDLGIEEFVSDGNEYVAYLTLHALTRSTETENGGLLVDDYSHPDGSGRTHSALNHQLAEILLLYLSSSEEAHSVADRMLLGIEDTENEWIKPDGDLYYAYYPDGSFGGDDYPYLTYNDLLALDQYLGGNETLERLMESKRDWMDANGITGYNK